jgi:hypothetical protein
VPITDLTLAVVGADFPNKSGPSRRMEILICAPGELVNLVPEPKNPKDKNAVMVVSVRDVQIGYVTAERAPWIKSMMAAGREIKAIFQEPTKFGALIRVSLDGNDPDLPPEREPPPQNSGFYPDDVWPDE